MNENWFSFLLHIHCIRLPLILRENWPWLCLFARLPPFFAFANHMWEHGILCICCTICCFWCNLMYALHVNKVILIGSDKHGGGQRCSMHDIFYFCSNDWERPATLNCSFVCKSLQDSVWCLRKLLPIEVTLSVTSSFCGRNFQEQKHFS